MYKVLNDQRSENQNDPEIPPYICQSEWLRSNSQVTTHIGEDVEKEEHSSTAGGIANLYASVQGKARAKKWECVGRGMWEEGMWNFWDSIGNLNGENT